MLGSSDILCDRRKCGRGRARFLSKKARILNATSIAETKPAGGSGYLGVELAEIMPQPLVHSHHGLSQPSVHECRDDLETDGM